MTAKYMYISVLGKVDSANKCITNDIKCCLIKNGLGVEPSPELIYIIISYRVRNLKPFISISQPI